MLICVNFSCEWDLSKYRVRNGREATGKIYGSYYFGFGKIYLFFFSLYLFLLLQNVSGTLTAVINLLATYLSPSHRTAAIYYFITALFVLLACFDTYFALPLIVSCFFV